MGCFIGWLVLLGIGHKIPYLNLSLPLFLDLFFGATLLSTAHALKSLRSRVLITLIAFGLAVFQFISHGNSAFFFWWIGVLTTPRIDIVRNQAFLFRKLQPLLRKWNLVQPLLLRWLTKYFNVFVFLLLVAITFYFFRDALSLYFQGDEWYHFLKYQESVKKPWWFVYGLVRVFEKSNPLGFHMSPIHEWITLWLFHVYGLRFLPYIVTFLIVHSLNGFLVFLFAKQLTKNTVTSFIAALFFTISVSHQQAITWAAAAPATTLAVMWVLLCLIALFKFFESENKKQLYLSFFFLFLAVMTKETGLLLVPLVSLLYILHRRPRPLKFITELWGVWLSLGIFGAIRYFFAPVTVDATGAVFDLKLGLSTFRYFSFVLKGFSQLFLPSALIKELSIWITDMQFPFFNSEKLVQGTTYVNFVQGPAYELVSYCLSFIFLIILILLKPSKKVFGTALLVFLTGIVPLIGLTYVFPFWGYTPSIDSRHIYHLSIAAALLFSVAAVQIARLASQFFPSKRRTVAFAGLLMLMVGAWAIWQFSAIHTELEQLRPDAIQRKRIISSVMNSVGTPPQKMIIYVKSDHSYYGFATYMLPFQTAFSHMLPVLFSKTYNPDGIEYPHSFYGEEFLPTGGLVSQGYFEDQGFGLGFFLEKVPLIKTLEKYKYTTEMIYSFKYDGRTYDMAPTNKEFREEIQLLLSSREQFQNWKRYGTKEDLLSFQIDPSWTVTTAPGRYVVSDAQGVPILEIQVIQNTANANFSIYVGEQLYQGKKIATNYLTSYLTPDLDQPHIIIGADLDKDFFGVSGHNKNFYHFKVSNKKAAQLIFRTFEFVDAEADEISLPDAVTSTQ